MPHTPPHTIRRAHGDLSPEEQALLKAVFFLRNKGQTREYIQHMLERPPPQWQVHEWVGGCARQGRPDTWAWLQAGAHCSAHPAVRSKPACLYSVNHPACARPLHSGCCRHTAAAATGVAKPSPLPALVATALARAKRQLAAAQSCLVSSCTSLPATTGMGGAAGASGTYGPASPAATARRTTQGSAPSTKRSCGRCASRRGLPSHKTSPPRRPCHPTC